ncbi:unnamed protein product, partial [Amoebophrya sp. A25]|eukprot:GSA25T00007080001.1
MLTVRVLLSSYPTLLFWGAGLGPAAATPSPAAASWSHCREEFESKRGRPQSSQEPVSDATTSFADLSGTSLAQADSSA